MLSYRHSYHAGNFADVLKHIVVIEILEHLCKKETPFDYIDTHAGAGLYSLEGEHATKTGEYKNGIGKINFANFPELSSYQKIIQSCNNNGSLKNYPGSPYIARQYQRQHDRLWLYEMHPTDYENLAQLMHDDRQTRIERSDGFKGLLAKVPPISKRGFVLIDPSYEIKQDYNLVYEMVLKAYKKFSTGTYAIWYPVINRSLINDLEQKFITSGIKKVQLFELGLAKDSKEWGMTSSGMIVINPPWKLMENMSLLLPKLLKALGSENSGHYRCLELVGED
ncbi:MAG: 23S rRNA (adenine(2030)-N(6))-methyltransferase RlmJ [Emcibacter sp.]|nr:23S rRNA (adenine(2030)-N(6))-methyltransferase RlmJ [Emcibacter sp.]